MNPTYVFYYSTTADFINSIQVTGACAIRCRRYA